MIAAKRNDPLHVLILWHMHQPVYREPDSRDYLLPWVRLHAVKDYFDMVHVLEDFPDVHVTFNLVPSLVEQLRDYVDNGAEDDFLQISLKPAAKLTLEDKIFLLKNFFSLNFDNMIQPYPRYKELFEKRGYVVEPEQLRTKAEHFTEQDFRDLQVWYNLAWSGEALKSRTEIRTLIQSGRSFTEADKQKFFAVHRAFMGEILPAYRKAADEGRIEISTSPFFHPILPLLCNINSAREALPNLELPLHDFHYAEDARWHIRQAVLSHERSFGRPPRGLWPSEGSVSDEILPIIRDAGFDWIATDEEILQASLRRSGLLDEGSAPPVDARYGNYACRTPGGPLRVFFRDHLLSDMIGFTYSTYDGEAAAEDLVSRLMLIRKMLPDDDRRFAVPIILDGENAWEYYPENGIRFLRAFYSRISASPYLEAVTFSEYLDRTDDPQVLPRIRAGSWIYGTFSTWVGHPEKNRAWDLLAGTRKKLEERRLDPAAGPGEEERLKEAHKALMAAEGSDWFWWYGEDHFSEYDREFDQLFRSHLQTTWRRMGLEPPEEFFKPIIQKTARFRVQRPFELITPTLDGIITDYFEWLAAGYFSNQYSFTTMQQVHRIFSGFWYGFDHENLYIRLDVDNTILNDRKYAFRVDVVFRKPGNVFFRMVKDAGAGTLKFERVRQDEAGRETDLRSIPLVGVDRIVELGIPFSEVGAKENQGIEFALKIYIGNNLAEQMPHDGYLSQKIAIDDLERYYWVV